MTDRIEFPPPSAPFAVAQQLYDQYRADKVLIGNGRRKDRVRTLLAWRGGWMQWHGTHWAEIDAAHLRSSIYEILHNAVYEHVTKDGSEIKPWNPDKHKIANVLEAMAAVGHLSTDIDPPSWIVHSPTEIPAAQVISCTNGVLDVSTRRLTEHTPALFNVVSVPFDYEQHAAEPTAWLDFLASVWADDQESIRLLQEFFGYVLCGSTDMQKALLLIGPTRSGKGTIGRILTELIGRGHVAGPTLASLGTNFGLSPLLGKPLAIISDARLGNIPSHTVVERLLSITGEDTLTVDRKFRDPWTGKLPTRFVILTNELPRFRDSSGAIANRLLILRMTKSFLGHEDRTLEPRLRGRELPAILAWALEGLDRLTRTGKFTEPQSSRDAANLMMDLASPVSAFVRDRCIRKPSEGVLRDTLYEAWKAWAEENGHKPGAKATFGRDLRAVVPELRDSQPRTGDGRIRQYEGIGLRPVHETYARNGDQPVPPVPDGESPVQGTLVGTGDPVPTTATNPLVNSTGTGGTGESALSAQQLDGTGNRRPGCVCIGRTNPCYYCELAASATGGQPG
ncbi:DNA primase family protein [Mycobacterium seoulense]|uniref:DNA primase family protein n=1 Tax=Mycobacterium seoulense TaxID=386911 RepID=UPI003CE6F23B